MSNVLQTLDVEESVSLQQDGSSAQAKKTEENDSNEIGLQSPITSFWSFTRHAHRYFTQRKYSENLSFQNKAFKNKSFQASFRSILLTDKHLILEQPTPHLVDAKRYLSHAKLQLEGG